MAIVTIVLGAMFLTSGSGGDGGEPADLDT